MEWNSWFPVFLVAILWIPTCDGQHPLCWTNITVNGTDFKLCTDSIPRAKAQNACVSINMTLAVVSTSGLFNHFKKFLTDNFKLNNIWVGATFSKNLTSFVWETGEIVSPSFYSTGTTLSTCCYGGMCLLYSSNDQMLSPLNCSLSRGFLCQEVPEPATFTTASLTTADPQATTLDADAPSTVNDLTTDSTSSSSNSATGNAMMTSAPPSGEMTSAASTGEGENVSTDESAEASLATSSAGLYSIDTTMSYMGNISTSSASTTPGDCMCECFVVDVPLNKTQRDALMAEETVKIRQHLILNIETLSSYMRKKISIMDSRPSATFVGGVGIVVMVSTFLLIVLMDATYIIQFIHGIAQKLHASKGGLEDQEQS